MVERLLNLFWILLGSGGAWHAWTLGLRGPSGPESGLFPFIASCAIACLGLALMATRRSAASNPQWPDAGAGLRAAGVAVGIALMAFGMDRIGFVAAAAIAMPVLLTAGAIAAIVLIFGRLLGMPLPRGPWGW